jgi:Xaa-Pro aminopeptidase
MRHNPETHEEANMDAKSHAARREALRKSVPEGGILIMGNDEAPKNYVDNPYRLREDSTLG